MAKRTWTDEERIDGLAKRKWAIEPILAGEMKGGWRISDPSKNGTLLQFNGRTLRHACDQLLAALINEEAAAPVKRGRKKAMATAEA